MCRNKNTVKIVAKSIEARQAIAEALMTFDVDYKLMVVCKMSHFTFNVDALSYILVGLKRYSVTSHKASVYVYKVVVD